MEAAPKPKTLPEPGANRVDRIVDHLNWTRDLVATTKREYADHRDPTASGELEAFLTEGALDLSANVPSGGPWEDSGGYLSRLEEHDWLGEEGRQEREAHLERRKQIAGRCAEIQGRLGRVRAQAQLPPQPAFRPPEIR